MKRLQAEHLMFEYIRRDEKGNVIEVKEAIRDLSFSVEAGEFVAVLGANGSGKSTLAKLIHGILKPTAGILRVNGYDTTEEENIWKIRQSTGMVFQNPDNQIIGTLVEEDVGFGPENLGVPTEEIWSRVERSLYAVGMYEQRKSPIAHLSGGQKQRVAIAGVLAMEPSCIVLDEATSMLDPMGRLEVLRVIQMLHQEKQMTVFWITHDMEEAKQADRILVLKDGKLSMEGTPKEIFSQEEALKKHALEVPQVTALSNELKVAGISLPDGILSVEELVEELCRQNKYN